MRERGAITIEEAVRRLTSLPAAIYGFADRGLIREGYAADLVLLDPDTVRSLPPKMEYDLPAGAQRLTQSSEGIACTIVNGQVLIEDNQPTGALPGRVLRNRLARRA